MLDQRVDPLLRQALGQFHRGLIRQERPRRAVDYPCRQTISFGIVTLPAVRDDIWATGM